MNIVNNAAALKYDEYKYVREKRLDATSKKSELAEKNSQIPR